MASTAPLIAFRSRRNQHTVRRRSKRGGGFCFFLFTPAPAYRCTIRPALPAVPRSAGCTRPRPVRAIYLLPREKPPSVMEARDPRRAGGTVSVRAPPTLKRSSRAAGRRPGARRRTAARRRPWPFGSGRFKAGMETAFVWEAGPLPPAEPAAAGRRYAKAAGFGAGADPWFAPVRAPSKRG